MALCEQNMDLNSVSASAVLSNGPIGRLSFGRFARVLAQGVRLHRLAIHPVVVYKQRIKELRLNQESIQYSRQMGNFYSQLARQAPK